MARPHNDAIHSKLQFSSGRSGLENGLTELPEIDAPNLDSPLSQMVSFTFQTFLAVL
jgi:hypothetical protein